MKPFVTAVLPLHNHACWVQDAIWSVVRQGYRPLQIVVVNDGSTDDSRDKVLALMKSPKQLNNVFLGTVEDLKIALLDYPAARGPSFARNQGIKYAWPETDIFALLDADDLYEQGKISKSVAKLCQSELIGMVYTDYDTLNPQGLRLRQYKEPYSRERLMADCHINCDSLVKKKAFDDVGLFDESLRVCEDFHMWARLTERYVAAHIAESLLTIRVGEHSSSSTVSKETWQKCYQKVMDVFRRSVGP